jgi:hypothetical protein
MVNVAGCSYTNWSILILRVAYFGQYRLLNRAREVRDRPFR